MTRFFAPHHLAAAHLVLCALALVWNLWVAGRAARVRNLPRAIAFLSARGGLLIVPALVVLLVSNSLLTGRTLFSMVWIWPATVLLVTAQALFVLARRRTAIPIGVPIVALDLLLFGVAVAHWLDLLGAGPAGPLLALLAADRGAIAFTAQPMALLAPWFLFVPIFAPITPGRRGPGVMMRVVMAVIAAAWAVSLLANIAPGARAVRSYDRYARERLQERPDSDFVIGLKVFPSLSAPPAPISVSSDLSLADSVGPGALSVYVTPEGTMAATLDSLAHVLDDVRTDKVLVVALDLSREKGVPPSAQAAYLRDRVADVARIERHLHPEMLVPVVDPAGAASRTLGPISVGTWESYLRNAADAAHRDGSTVRVMAHVGGFGPADSALYRWAASSASPVDVVGISLYPWLGGAATLDARMRTADAWSRLARSAKPGWVLETGGFPLAFGEENQARALWGVLAWATSRASIKGVIVYQASDYGVPVGLRTAGVRLRPIVATMRRATGELHGTAMP